MATEQSMRDLTRSQRVRLCIRAKSLMKELKSIAEQLEYSPPPQTTADHDIKQNLEHAEFGFDRIKNYSRRSR